MIKYLLLYIVLVGGFQYASAQADSARFFIGASYGTSLSIGDFSDNKLTNSNAGFAKNGQKFELYGGKAFNNKKVTITTTFRFQNFKTETINLIEKFEAEDPGVNYEGSSGNWKTYALLMGATYKMIIGRKLDIYPRIGIGPLVVSSPNINVSTSTNSDLNFSHSSETGIGVGYEFGIGTSTSVGKHFVLLPTFTFSGGLINIKNVETVLNNVSNTKNYQPKIHSFNLGFSLAYRFY